MTNSRLLGPLVDAIETARRQMLEKRRELAANETRTRNALIDPVLGALDWNVSNPSQVTTEYELPSGRVDYALLGQNGKALAIIEAKRLGDDLEKHRGQLVRYAYESKPTYAVLTNGELWEVYGVRAGEKDFRLQQLFEHSLSENDPLQSARKLLMLWQPNLVSVQADEEEREPVPPPEPPVPPISPQPNDDWVPFSTFNASPNSKLPRRIRFPNGTVRKLTNWRSIIDVTTQWLFDTGKLTVKDLPLRYGDRGGTINTTPTRPNGSELASWYQVPSEQIYVNAHGPRSNIVRRARNILAVLEVDPKTVEVLPRP